MRATAHMLFMCINFHFYFYSTNLCRRHPIAAAPTTLHEYIVSLLCHVYKAFYLYLSGSHRNANSFIYFDVVSSLLVYANNTRAANNTKTVDKLVNVIAFAPDVVRITNAS